MKEGSNQSTYQVEQSEGDAILLSRRRRRLPILNGYDTRGIVPAAPFQAGGLSVRSIYRRRRRHRAIVVDVGDLYSLCV